MTPGTIELVQDTFKKIAPFSEIAADLFYSKLFELDPKLKPLFKDDINEQGRKLMKMIETAVSSLHNLESLVPALQALGRRHVDYGVTEDDYVLVGEALIWALQAGLGEDFSDDAKSAWIEVYQVLASVMKDAVSEYK